MNNDLKNSINFLNKKTKKENGFTVPNGYFEELDERILHKEEVNIPKKYPFQTPDSYFDSLENAVFEKLAEEKSANDKKVIPLYKRVVRLIPSAVAASVLIFVGYMYVISSNSLDFNAISVSDVENWYENGYLDTTDDDFISAFIDTDINFETETFNTLSFDNDNMEDYLNDLEENTLINEIQ